MPIVPVRPIDGYAAWRLLQGPFVDDDALQQVARDEARRANLFGAYDGATLHGAVYAEVVPGAAAVLWPPRTSTPNAALEDALMQTALAHVRSAKFVQVFLDAHEPSAALLRNGFRHLTNVAQLEWTKQPVAQTRLRLQAGDSNAFREMLWRCHVHSDDCPELNGVRTLAETLAGYRDVAPDETQWLLAFDGPEPVGVLVLAHDEVCFLGVHEARRHRGYGRDLLGAAAARSSAKMSLIVDGRNTAALRLYQSFGFVQVAQRVVFLMVRSA